MEPINKLTGMSKGLEVLFFEDAEVQKIKGGLPSFATSGTLSVLYFKDYNRFFLRLNGWLYPLMRRLPMMGLDQDSVHTRTYLLPGPKGATFKLTINSAGSEQGFENLESIFQDSSKFSWKGHAHTGKLDLSPDDKLARQLKKDTGMKEMISEGFKQGLHSIKTKIETFKTGTKNINSRKKALDLKSIKTKNFRKSARSTFKKDFFQTGEKLSQEFLKMRRENLNMSLPRSFKELMSDSGIPSLYFWKDELEDAILNYRDIATQGNINLSDISAQQPSLTQALKEGMKDIKDTISGSERRRENLTQDRTRERNLNSDQLSGQSTMSQLSVHEHYEG